LQEAVALIRRRSSTPGKEKILAGKYRSSVQSRAGGTRFVAVQLGRITIDSSPGMRAQLPRVLESDGCNSLASEFHEVSEGCYAGTSGVAVLMEALQGARGAGEWFQLDKLQRRRRYSFRAIGLLHFFDRENPRGDGAASTLGARAPLRDVECVGGLTTQLIPAMYRHAGPVCFVSAGILSWLFSQLSSSSQERNLWHKQTHRQL
jgi:hypothetical protein